MLSIEIPGQGLLRLEHLVLDYNGTVAKDGEILPGVAPRLAALARDLRVHVVTADTFGTVAARVAGLPLHLCLLPPGGQDQAKLDFVRSLGATSVASLGNGRNDALMLRESALGVAVMGGEGAASAAMAAADVVCASVLDGLDVLLNPLRLVATLRT